MSREQEEQQKKLNKMLGIYLDKVHILSEKNENLELETKMGGFQKSITRINYENVIKKLKSLGFVSNEKKVLLRIQNVGNGIENTIRAEIEGIHNVRKYCQTNLLSLERTDGSTINGISFIQKQPFRVTNEAESVKSIDYPDFDFRISLMNEKKVDKDSALVQDLIKEDKWKRTKKVFRYTNRHTFYHPDPEFPFMVDISIVKSSRQDKNGRGLVPEYTIQDAGVFRANERFEIEIECINTNIGIGTLYNNVDKINTELKKTILHILAGIQETNFPISYKEQADVLQKYMQLFSEDVLRGQLRVNPDNFVGPSSVTLQRMHILKPTEEEQDQNKESPLVPNINIGYTVTEKADGDRKLLFIDEGGKVYLITTNLQVQFTGAVTPKKRMFNTLFDGEHILHDRHGRFINRYAAFDVYFVGSIDIREREFVETKLTKHKEGTIYRLDFLEDIIESETVGAMSVINKTLPSPLTIVKKEFYYTEKGDGDIFKKCAIILSKIRDHLFDYETDGLIFTPGYLGVGQSPDKKIDYRTMPSTMTWKYSLKWKPEEKNTIDFLVATKKNTAGIDDIKYISSSGLDTSSSLQINSYKTLILLVGYDEKNHSNPYQDMINDKIPISYWEEKNMEKADKGYVPAQFFPTDPYDQYAGLCNIQLRESGNDELLMMSEGNEVFEDNMIVEFRYDKKREQQWRWVPIRVRYDKTAKLRAGMKSYGNAYHVANDNWNSIHNPVTEEMIATGKNIPINLGDDDVYYNKVSGVSKTRALRDFHNLYVKNLLIKSVSKRDDTLIDLAVGKGGDFPKWINAKLKFVLGIDIARDNIQNRLNGACKRYLNFRQKTRNMPSALFVNGDSSKNIRNTDAFETEKDKQMVKAVFGQGPKNENDLGKGVYKEYDIGKEGFDVCSIQFAIHYMFKSPETLHSFLRNVSETTKLGGYFIGTSYDGKIMYEKLKNIAENESVTIMEEGQKLWEVKKKYNQNEFLDDASSIGYAIDVYQDSINKYFIEYLVNYDYLTRLIENYGFVLLKREEYTAMNMPSSSGLFKDLFKAMEDEIHRDGRKEKDYADARRMSSGERTISFLNRYFIYKKVRNVDALKEMERNLGIGQPTQKPEAAAAVIIVNEEEIAPKAKTIVKGKKLTGKKLVIQ
jgi:hypothetical protein